MIAESGIMIGFYIITRMVSLIRERVRTSGMVGLVVWVFALITILVAIAVIIDLSLRGTGQVPGMI